MSSKLSYRLHGREQRPKTRPKHYRDELDTGQVKASAKEPRACSVRRLVMVRSQFSARAPTASSGAPRRRTVSSSRTTVVTEDGHAMPMPVIQAVLRRQLESAAGGNVRGAARHPGDDPGDRAGSQR